MNTGTNRAGLWSAVGSTVSGAVASSCCWLPLVLLALGAGTASAGKLSSAVETYRVPVAVVSVGLLGASWYFTFLRRPAPLAGGAGESCCAVPAGPAEPGRCSCCGTGGIRVPASTVRALVRGDLRGQVREGSYLLCPNPGCAQVYTAPEGARSLAKPDLAVRVGFKEQDAPHLVCYCFEHSAEEIEGELHANGHTGIPESISNEVKAGRCACDVKNPKGSCCLGDVNRAVAQAKERLAGKEIPVGAPAVQCAPPPPLQEDHEGCCGLPVRRLSFSGWVTRANRVALPFLTVAVLASIFFPERVFSLLPTGQEPGSAPQPGLRTVLLRVPGMT
jgi:hypothetical protein